MYFIFSTSFKNFHQKDFSRKTSFAFVLLYYLSNVPSDTRILKEDTFVHKILKNLTEYEQMRDS